MGSRGERIVGLLGLGSVFLEVFYCGGSFYGCAVYRELVLLYDRYLPLMSARYMLALTSATPGMPYAVHVRALGISTYGRSRSRVTPVVGSVRTQVALTARVSMPPTRSTAAPRMPRYPRRPACARDLFFLMNSYAPHYITLHRIHINTVSLILYPLVSPVRIHINTVSLILYPLASPVRIHIQRRLWPQS
jgi:hypothetical protein